MSSTGSRALIPRKRQSRGAKRIEDIVAAAADLFATHGFEGTSMSAIAKAAGLTIGSLYQYFPSRDAIVDAVAERYLREFQRRREAFAAGPPPRTLHEAHLLGASDVFDFFARNAGVKPFLDADPARAASIRAFQEAIAMFVPIWAAYYPDVPHDDLQRTALIVSTISRGAASLLATAERSDDERRRLVEEIACACEAYMIARHGKPRRALTR